MICARWLAGAGCEGYGLWVAVNDDDDELLLEIELYCKLAVACGRTGT